MSQLFSPNPKLVPTRACTRKRGFTLVEILVALVVSLILMGAVVSLFGFLGDTFNNAKADIEMSERIAHTRELLQGDFNNSTVNGRLAVPGQPQPGALEIVEGRERDKTVTEYNRQRWEENPDTVKLDERLGDRDDILYLTVRNNLRPYVGKQGIPISGGYVAGGSIESPLAEVLWFVTRDPKNPGRGRLHRYQVLIAPDADLGEASPNDFFRKNDISARLDTVNNVRIPNSLEDLSLRGARRGHVSPSNSADLFDPRFFLDIDSLGTDLKERLEETVVLDNVVAFDLKVYDEAAPVVGLQKPGTTSGFGGGVPGSGASSGGGSSGGGSSGGGSSGGGSTGGGSTGGSPPDPDLLPPIDNSSPGFSTTGGNWSDGSGDGYQGQYKYKEAATGPGTATWSFTVETPGDYDVYITWPNIAANAATNAKFFVSGNGATISKEINQRGAPSGVTYGGATFQKLGTVAADGTIVVTLDFIGADGPIIADAAAIKPRDGSGSGNTTSGGAGQSTGGIGATDGSDALVARTFSLLPNDLGYQANLNWALANTNDPAGPQIVGYGAFVDLYQYIPTKYEDDPNKANINSGVVYNPSALGAPALQFNQNGHSDSRVYATGNPFDLTLNANTTMPAVYDTWSPWYNPSAVNQIDDDGRNGVDDPGELDMPPPYSAPLRAIQATIRVYEPSSGTVREVTVARSFDQD